MALIAHMYISWICSFQLSWKARLIKLRLQRSVIRIYNRINQVSRFIQGETDFDVFICGGDGAFF